MANTYAFLASVAQQLGVVFFMTIFLPLIKAGVGVAAFFCFMFSWVELLLARTLTSVNAKPTETPAGSAPTTSDMTRTPSASSTRAFIHHSSFSIFSIWFAINIVNRFEKSSSLNNLFSFS